ncbi:hypothetical protein [Croceicoccus mobilis]|uniref:hypothetical protein n=1 Tax=Croceicoccus mobilis TaxID=1703339 RepID=UPI000ABBA03D|nr:hypothetical protein [Croceicoccus mobilis]
MRLPEENAQYSPDKVRGGSEEHVVRYVLGSSLGLAIVTLTTTWIGSALILS